MSNSPFLVLRYPPGGAGRFLSTTFQCSDNVAFWDPSLEDAKRTNGFNQAVINYVETKFPEDLAYHLRLEPDLPYASDFYSGTYDRGSELTINAYNQLMHSANDTYYFANVNEGKKVNLILHKSQIPTFMFGALFVNVVVTSQRAENWVMQMLWLKHYKEIGNNQILCLTHDANFCNPKRKHLVEKYFSGSPVLTVKSIEEFKANTIKDINNLDLFSTTDKLFQHPSNSCVTNIVFDLDNIFSADLYIDNILDICKRTSLSIPDADLLHSIYNIWWNRQQC